MIDPNILKGANLTEGEAKVYLALLDNGESSVGPICEKSGVSHSVIYKVLERLKEKGLVSYIIKDKTKIFSGSNPEKLLEYIDEQQRGLEENKKQISSVLPQLLEMQNSSGISARIYEGFKGVQSAANQYKTITKPGDIIYLYGVHAYQSEQYNLFWQKHHIERNALGVKMQMLFNRDTALDILRNRNSFDDCDTRWMPTDVVTDAWVMIVKNLTVIFLQDRNIAISIEDQQIANTFKTYFDDYWRNTIPFEEEVKIREKKNDLPPEHSGLTLQDKK